MCQMDDSEIDPGQDALRELRCFQEILGRMLPWVGSMTQADRSLGVPMVSHFNLWLVRCE